MVVFIVVFFKPQNRHQLKNCGAGTTDYVTTQGSNTYPTDLVLVGSFGVMATRGQPLISGSELANCVFGGSLVGFKGCAFKIGNLTTQHG